MTECKHCCAVRLSLPSVGWFSVADRHRIGFSRQHCLDTKLGCGCLFWEIEGNLGFSLLVFL